MSHPAIHVSSVSRVRIDSDSAYVRMLAEKEYVAHCYSRESADLKPVEGGNGSPLRVTFQEKIAGDYLVATDEESKEDLLLCRLSNMKDRRWTTPVRCDWGEDDSPGAWTIVFQKRYQAEDFEETLRRVLSGSPASSRRAPFAGRAEVLGLAAPAPEPTPQPVSSRAVHPVLPRDHGRGAEPASTGAVNISLREMEEALERSVEEARKSRKTLNELPFDFIMGTDDEDVIYDFMNDNPDFITGEKVMSYDFWNLVLEIIRPIAASTSILYKYFHSVMIFNVKRSKLNVELQLLLLQFFNFRLTSEDRRVYFTKGWLVLVDPSGLIVRWEAVSEEVVEQARSSQRPISPIGSVTRQSRAAVSRHRVAHANEISPVAVGPTFSFNTHHFKRSHVPRSSTSSFPASPAAKASKSQVRYPYTMEDREAQWIFVHEEMCKNPRKELRLSNAFWNRFVRYPQRKADTWRKHFETIKASLHEESLPAYVMRDLYLKLKLRMTAVTKQILEDRFNASIQLSAGGTVMKWEENAGSAQQVHQALTPHPLDETVIANNGMVEEDDDKDEDQPNPDSPVFRSR